MSKKRNFLEADERRLEQNLKFVNNDLEKELNEYFAGGAGGSNEAPPRDYKVVVPKPGFCVKTFKVNTEEKYFINVCQTDDIPAPEDITELQLAQILESDTPSSFRIPMSISEPRQTKDKSNNTVDVCDIAINAKFFVKCEKSIMFKEFFLALIAEALSEKYNVQIKINKAVILNNRKFIGKLVSHRVRNDDVKTVLKSYQNPADADKKKLMHLDRNKTTIPPLVQELNQNELNKLKQTTQQLQQNATKIREEITQANPVEPEYKLRAKLRNQQVEELLAEFYLPQCISSHEFTLNIGEDRILLESIKHGYLYDKYVNFNMNQQRARAIFDKTNKMLQLRIPIILA